MLPTAVENTLAVLTLAQARDSFPMPLSFTYEHLLSLLLTGVAGVRIAEEFL